MSTDYYARLEQQRGPHPSEQMLTALARGLRLTLDERDHLFRLAGQNPPPRASRSGHLSPTLMRVLDRLDDTPALVLSDLAETLVQNRLAVALLGDQRQHTGLARSAYYRWFTDPAERAVYPLEDHPRQDRMLAAGLRAAVSAGGGDPRAEQIVHTLLERSPTFARVWEQHHVSRRFDDTRRSCIPSWVRSRLTVRPFSPRTSSRRCWYSRQRRDLKAPRSSDCSA